jgi:hypothetical protein
MFTPEVRNDSSSRPERMGRRRRNFKLVAGTGGNLNLGSSVVEQIDYQL